MVGRWVILLPLLSSRLSNSGRKVAERFWETSTPQLAESSRKKHLVCVSRIGLFR